MQTLDSIFLDKLDQKYCKKPRLWPTSKNCYVTLLELDENYIWLENEDGNVYKMPRNRTYEKTFLKPSKESTNWDNWRKYLFENRVDFIALSSYILQSARGDNLHLIESTYALPYLITDVETGSVITARGESLIVDINRYRFATQNEIDRFLKIAKKFYFLDIEWIDDKKVWSWSYGIKDNVPKFLPGDLVALRNHFTGEIFDGGYYVKDIIKKGDKYEYRLVFPSDKFDVLIPEEYLVGCEIVIKDKVTERVDEIINVVVSKNEEKTVEQKDEEDTDFLL